MCEMNIGIEEDVANLIAGEVDVIINSAATTTFDERYIARPAFDTCNLLCTCFVRLTALCLTGSMLL